MLPTLFAQIDVLTQLLISTLSHSNDNSCIVMQSVFFSPETDQFSLVMSSSGAHDAFSKDLFPACTSFLFSIFHCLKRTVLYTQTFSASAG